MCEERTVGLEKVGTRIAMPSAASLLSDRVAAITLCSMSGDMPLLPYAKVSVPRDGGVVDECCVLA